MSYAEAMKSKWLPILFVNVLLVLGMSACADQSKSDDSSLKANIEENFKKDTSLAGRKIDVAVDKGVVTLKGAVGTATEKAQAAKLAAIDGVTQVRDDLSVDVKLLEQKANEGIEKAADATDKAADKSANVLDKAAAATKNGTDKALDKTKGLLDKLKKKSDDVSSDLSK